MIGVDVAQTRGGSGSKPNSKPDRKESLSWTDRGETPEGCWRGTRDQPHRKQEKHLPMLRIDVGMLGNDHLRFVKATGTKLRTRMIQIEP